MRRLIALAALVPAPALAHPGHVLAADGHHHGLALLALVGAAAGSAWLVRADRRRARTAKDGARA